MFTAHVENQLNELSVITPFSEATGMTEVEESGTIHLVLPTVLYSNAHMLKET